MAEHIADNVNELPFKLRFTSTQKLHKELVKMINDRHEVVDKLADEYDHIGQHKHILANIKDLLETCHQSLKDLRALCQCQSDDDRDAASKQLATSEEALAKHRDKIDKIQLIKCIDVTVKRLPSNWRAAMLRIARERDRVRKELKESQLKDETSAEANEANGQMKTETDGQVSTEDNKQTEEVKSEENNCDQQMDENLIASEAAAEEISHQFEKDLERKIYETQVEELMQLIQQLVMRIKTMRARTEISKQLVKVVLKYKRELESANSKLKESMATCHCSEAGPPDELDFQKRMEEKKRLEERVDSLSGDLKYWEEQYSILKEGRNKNKENELKVEVMAAPQMTTVVEVANEEEVAHDYTQMAGTSHHQQQSCMFAGQTSQTAATIHSVHSQGTANPAVIYLEGLVANQQPTYIPANVTNLGVHQPLSVYPHAYALGHPHHPYAHQAPDGSIQVYSTDIASHPGYIAYQ